MIEKKKRRQNYYMRKQILSECGDNPTAEDVLDLLLGDEYGPSRDYVVYRYDKPSRTIFNRINAIWLYPLFFIAMPIKWVFTGEFGIGRNSFIGRIIEKLAKFD